jgi:hypothetical protein
LGRYGRDGFARTIKEEKVRFKTVTLAGVTAKGIPYSCDDQQTGSIDLDIKGPFKLTNIAGTSPPDKTFDAAGTDTNGFKYTLSGADIDHLGKLAGGDIDVADFTMPSTVTPPTSQCEAANFLVYTVMK